MNERLSASGSSPLRARFDFMTMELLFLPGWFRPHFPRILDGWGRPVPSPSYFEHGDGPSASRPPSSGPDGNVEAWYAAEGRARDDGKSTSLDGQSRFFFSPSSQKGTVINSTMETRTSSELDFHRNRFIRQNASVALQRLHSMSASYEAPKLERAHRLRLVLTRSNLTC
jgi:hypothetical protein